MRGLPGAGAQARSYLVVMKRRWVHVPLAVLAAAALLLLATCFHRIVDSTRGTPVGELQDGASLPPMGEPAFARLLSALAATPLAPGHDIELHTVAAVSYARMFADMRSARRSLTLQSYYCLPGSVADSTVAILRERAQAGVRTLFLADGFGCRRFVGLHARTLQAAGVEVAVLRPVHWLTLHAAQHRSHVRLVVVDGRVAWTGGFGIDDKWLYGDGRQAAWRDSNVRFMGPAVHQAQAAFLSAWAEATRALLTAPDLFAWDDSVSAGSAVAGVQYHVPGLGTTPLERLIFVTTAAARERLYIANAYFLPSAVQRAALAEASRRGVDVRILTAGSRSDVPSTRFASRAYYGELLAAGVRIYEYTATMMHAKTIVADGVFSSVGSMNFDNRSLRIDDELNLLVYDSAMAAGLEAVFRNDLLNAQEITAAMHAQRSRLERLRERLARMAQPLM
jgi:cardiolipin synthase A/B